MNTTLNFQTAFKGFLKQHIKAEQYAYVLFEQDLFQHYCETGSSRYELCSRYTKSGNPEIFSYTAKIKFDGDDCETKFDAI